MKRGYLSQYLEGISYKRLSAVDAEPKTSNQHEIGTTSEMRKAFLGEEHKKFQTTFIYLVGEDESITEFGEVTHYDARKNKPNRSSEWRLYYPTNGVTEIMSEGDSLFLAKAQNEDNLIFIITEADSTEEAQLLWLFGIEKQIQQKFGTQITKDKTDYELDFASRFILDELGIEFEDTQANTIDEIIDQFNGTFPTTAQFSHTARLTLPEVDALDDPDRALSLWLEHEDKMFKRLEQREIQKRINEGFMENGQPDVEGFLKYSGSVRQRRFSRMGLSLEHHLAAIFDSFQLEYTRKARTENKSKPDFLFPSQNEYWDEDFPPEKRILLGSKSTCKDRWRQILSEAAKIPNKHLVTLQPSISTNQTNEMKAHNLQLILPQSIHSSYKQEQQSWILNLADFIKYAKEKQQ